MINQHPSTKKRYLLSVRLAMGIVLVLLIGLALGAAVLAQAGPTLQTPTGACCTADGACVQMTRLDCHIPGGTYHGDGTSCAEATCDDSPVGACCLDDGSCAFRTEASCTAVGGEYNGDGADCAQTACTPWNDGTNSAMTPLQEATGSCCLPGDICWDNMTGGDCRSLSGSYNGDGTLCSDEEITCGDAYACCLANGSCVEMMAQPACEFVNGTYHPEQTCDDVACPQPTGACCNGINGQCLIVTQAGCAALGGDSVYHGDGSTCDAVTCDPKGACCYHLISDLCGEFTEAYCKNYLLGSYKGDDTVCASFDCENAGACCFGSACQDGYSDALCAYTGGVFKGVGSTCATVSCDEGACCKPDGSCEQATETYCMVFEGGTFYAGSDCSAVACPQPPVTGACCDEFGFCQEVPEANCVLGTYQGDGTVCDPSPCPPQPTGACCKPDGSCEPGKTLLECGAEGGDYVGDNSVCDPSPCQLGTGACYQGPGYSYACTDGVTKLICDAIPYGPEKPGAYQGDGSTCDSASWPMRVTKTADPAAVISGKDVTFTVLVENLLVEPYAMTVYLDSLMDDVHGDLDGKGNCVASTTSYQTIGPGESYTCQFTATVAGGLGFVETDVVTASGEDSYGYTNPYYGSYGDPGNTPISATGSTSVTVAEGYDFGDAEHPNKAYPTLLVNDGARHALGAGLRLGDCVDGEDDGQPTTDADDDDTNPGAPGYGTCANNNDDNGVTFTTPLTQGVQADIVVAVSADCTLSAWMDFDANGDWSDPGEELFPGGQALTAGANNLSFLVPADAVVGDTYARFRCTTDGPVGYAGLALDGEVEDYKVYIHPGDDGDGVPTAEESGPNQNDPNYDGNNDGTPDGSQASAASLHTADGKYYVTLEASGGHNLQDVRAVGNPSPGDAPEGVAFPYGFFEFSVSGIGPGGTFSLTIYLPAGESADTYWKYGPTPDNPTPHWYEFKYDGQTGAEINGNIIILHFVDGLRGDDNVISLDGGIKEPGGAGVQLIGGHTELMKRARASLWPQVALLVAALGAVMGAAAVLGKLRAGKRAT